MEILKFIPSLKKTRHILSCCVRFLIFTFHFHPMSFDIIHSQLSIHCHKTFKEFFQEELRQKAYLEINYKYLLQNSYLLCIYLLVHTTILYTH